MRGTDRMKKPIALIIMDGFGIAPKYGNAIDYARTPHLDQLFFQNRIFIAKKRGLLFQQATLACVLFRRQALLFIII